MVPFWQCLVLVLCLEIWRSIHECFVATGIVKLLVVPITGDYFKCLSSHSKLYKAFKYLMAVHIDYLKPERTFEKSFRTMTGEDENTDKHSRNCLFVNFDARTSVTKSGSLCNF